MIEYYLMINRYFSKTQMKTKNGMKPKDLSATCER